MICGEWKRAGSFLHDLDTRLKAAVALRCLGGFVVTQQYGIGRGTSDIDFLSICAMSAEDNVEVLAGLGSDLYKKYSVYLHTSACNSTLRLRGTTSTHVSQSAVEKIAAICLGPSRPRLVKTGA